MDKNKANHCYTFRNQEQNNVQFYFCHILISYKLILCYTSQGILLLVQYHTSIKKLSINETKGFPRFPIKCSNLFHGLANIVHAICFQKPRSCAVSLTCSYTYLWGYQWSAILSAEYTSYYRIRATAIHLPFNKADQFRCCFPCNAGWRPYACTVE